MFYWTPTSTLRTMTLARLVSSSLLLLQCGNRYFEQRAPTTPRAVVVQWQGGRKRLNSRMMSLARLESSYLLLPLPPYCSVEECQKDYS
jgi:hypothetical protein